MYIQPFIFTNRLIIIKLQQLSIMTNRINKATAANEAKCTAWENIKGWINNISYQIEEFSVIPLLTKPAQFFQGPTVLSDYFLSGNKIHSPQDFLLKFQSLIWITYRKNATIAPNYFSDVGWGCLLRVTQMAFANMLMGRTETIGEIDRLKIIEAFIEEKDAKYSIMNFVEVGFELWNRIAGDWYSMTETAMMLEALQERTPLKGTELIKVVVYNQTVSINDLLEQSGYDIENRKLNHNEKELGLSSVYQIPQSSLANDMSISKNNKQKEIFLMVTSSFNECSRLNDQKKLLRLMELPIFSSCIGGVPEKARLIIGKQGDKLCYLDPHYVQESVTKGSFHDSLNTFECKKPRWMKCSQLERNITFCFHIKSFQDIYQLMKTIDQIEHNQSRDRFISYSWSHSEQQRIVYQTEQIEPDFQILDIGSSSSQEIQRIFGKME